MPSLDRRFTLTVSARGIRTIDTRGVDAVVADTSTRGGRV